MSQKLLGVIIWTALTWSLPAQTEKTVAGTANRETIVGANDTVTIVALNVEEISRAWRVTSSGELNLPMVGRIQASGKSIGQLEGEITERLAKFVLKPQVTVFVSEVRSFPVTVAGAVARPGVIQVEGAGVLFRVLTQAGGPGDTASSMKLTRRKEAGPIPHPDAKDAANGEFAVLELPVKEVMRGYGQAAEIPILPFDTISVEAAKPPRRVHITGAVARAGAIELVSRDAISLSEAISVAGGLSSNAAPSKTLIRHINASGTETAGSRVNLKDILSGKLRDITLTDGDMVIVPDSAVKTYLTAATMSAITASVYILARF